MAERPRDYSFEALAQVTGVDITQLNALSRGPMNKALAAIRESHPELEDMELAILIAAKATQYRKVMGGAALTATALAKHWANLSGMVAAATEPQTYVSNDREYCSTCDGVRMVLAYTTQPKPSQLQLEMRKHDRRKRAFGEPVDGHATEGYEAWKPCPDCNQVALEKAVEYRRRFDRIHA